MGGGFLTFFFLFGEGGVWSLSLLLVVSSLLSLVMLLLLWLVPSSSLLGGAVTNWMVLDSWGGWVFCLCEVEDGDGVVNARGMMVTREVTCAELATIFPVSAVKVGMSRSLQHILVVWRPHVCVGRNRLWRRSATACRLRMISSWNRVLWNGVSRIDVLASLVCMRSSSVSVCIIKSLSSSFVSSSSVAGGARGSGSPSVSQSSPSVSASGISSCLLTPSVAAKTSEEDEEDVLLTLWLSP